MCEGRRARGESWGDLHSWRGSNEVWRTGQDEGKRKLIVRDNVVLSGSEIASRMSTLGVFGTVILGGPLFVRLSSFFLSEFSLLPRIGARDWGDGQPDAELDAGEKRRKERWKEEKEDGILWTAASVRGCVVVKFGAREVEGGRKWLGWMLREEESIGKDFGPGGLMFVR